MRHVIVMVTSSYPRVPGDSVGTFMDPIAKSLAARGHDVHVVAPWHPLVQRGPEEDGVRFHFYRYAPLRWLNVFGHAEAMRADVSLRLAAVLATPFALAQGWRVTRTIARRYRATMLHGHWVVPGGITAAVAVPSMPLVISLHGSDVYVAEKLAPARLAARTAFARAGAITACSDDLARRAIAIGADASRVGVVPYGVDAARFRPDARLRGETRASLGVGGEAALVFTAGRLVRKKGFEYLVDALASNCGARPVVAAIAGEGDLGRELRERARTAGVADRIRFLGTLTQDEVARHLSAADVVVVPSVRDDAGNVDGLPNVVLEALASGTPVVTTTAGGIGSVVTHGQTGLIVPERDARAIAESIAALADDPARAQRIGAAARALVQARFGWEETARRLEAAYDRALAFKSSRR